MLSLFVKSDQLERTTYFDINLTCPFLCDLIFIKHKLLSCDQSLRRIRDYRLIDLDVCEATLLELRFDSIFGNLSISSLYHNFNVKHKQLVELNCS